MDSDYLEIALQIGKDYPFVGAWGGQIRPEFEVTPPEWTKPYWGYLAIREFEKDKWSNLNQHEAAPCGAGMCVRKSVAEKYADWVNHDSKRLSLGRKGQLLLGGEDSDLAFTACDIGLGTGQFTSLRLTHLIPASRLEEKYLIRLIEGISYSHTILDSFRGKLPTLPKTSWKKKLVESYRFWKMNQKERRFYRLNKAIKRGMTLATQEILNF